MLSLLNRFIEAMSDAFNMRIQNTARQTKTSLSELKEDQIKDIALLKEICSFKGLPEKFETDLERKLSQEQSNPITVSELWQ
ncbi:hypothetical protein [Candidatus Cardinium hertigii]|uniref:Uncharacterized protein n=1 Tax=Candidatus Cardinium hertigii TaxID=247481 RepID=A0A2Z3LCV8_9BACT|nr:hypothetical protein [Candidatus Cardinium hertigii]AWN81696.1 hypothetical protein DK880_00368 [Candidatus Cardinium hertigii]